MSGFDSGFMMRHWLSASRVVRTRQLVVAPMTVWKVIEDPFQMPRWWPGVTRMEGVEDDRFTQVFQSKRGRTLRMDFRVLASDAPGSGGEPSGHRAWEQEVTGTPFERVLDQAITEVLLDPAHGATTLVTVVQMQKLRGYSRTGRLMLRRSTSKRLDEALDGLERICG